MYLFQLHCRRLRPSTHSSTESNEPFRLAPGTTYFNYTGLEPTTQYRCDINASTSRGSGQNTSLIVWTEAAGRSYHISLLDVLIKTICTIKKEKNKSNYLV